MWQVKGHDAIMRLKQCSVHLSTINRIAMGKQLWLSATHITSPRFRIYDADVSTRPPYHDA